MSKTDRVVAFLKPRYKRWVSVYAVIDITGPLSYRQEISRARKLGMRIEHRDVRIGRRVCSQVRYAGKAA